VYYFGENKDNNNNTALPKTGGNNMRNRRNVTVKFLLTAVILSILLPRLGIVTMWQAMFAAAVLTLAGYITDFILIAKINGPATLVIDTVLNTFLLWFVQLITPFMYLSFSAAFIVSLFLTMAEMVFHTFLRRQIRP